VTLVIIREDIMGKVDRPIPTMLDYRTHIEKGSMFNTPPVVPVYAGLHTLRWLKQNGGIAAMEKKNIEKAAILYDEIERNKLFTPTVEDEADRSLMNICFVMSEPYKELEGEFLELATARGMVGIKGHRSVGGFRASTYNALPRESAEALIDVMQEFESKS
jgi:phosphoserine aminotransferase